MKNAGRYKIQSIVVGKILWLFFYKFLILVRRSDANLRLIPESGHGFLVFVQRHCKPILVVIQLHELKDIIINITIVVGPRFLPLILICEGGGIPRANTNRSPAISSGGRKTRFEIYTCVDRADFRRK